MQRSSPGDIANVPAMRARQLYVQLKSAGYDPEYLMLKERYVLTCEVSGLGLARKHSALKLLPTGIFSKFANRIEPAAFIFTQANSPQEFKVASKRHRVILDCIARKDLEFAAMQRADLHKIYVATEKVYMDHADVILYTSPKLWDHINSNYDHDTAYNPFSFWPERRSKREKMTLAFGGGIPGSTTVKVFMQSENISKPILTSADFSFREK